MRIKKSLRKMAAAAAMAAGLLIATVGTLLFTNLVFSGRPSANYDRGIAWTLMTVCGVGASLFCFGLAATRPGKP